MNEREAENKIFDLRKKADLFLQVGDTEEFNSIQLKISELQKVSGVVKGAGEEKEHERTA